MGSWASSSDHSWWKPTTHPLKSFASGLVAFVNPRSKGPPGAYRAPSGVWRKEEGKEREERKGNAGGKRHRERVWEP